MNANEISFENLPKAVAFLSHQIEELKTIVKNKDTIEINNKKNPISIDQACTIIKKAKPTVYTLVRKRQIPHYKMEKSSISMKMNFWIGLLKEKERQFKK